MDGNNVWDGQSSILLVLLTISWSDGGYELSLLNILVDVFLVIPALYLQVLVGQYGQNGPIGIWRAFPLAQGWAIAWLFINLVFLCEKIIHESRVLFLLCETLFTRGYPWASCGQDWNSIHCRTHSFINGSGRSTGYGLLLFNPSEEYLYTTYSMEASSIAALAFAWIATVLPLIRGPKAFLKCLFVGFVVILTMNFFLFMLSITRPGVTEGLKYMFSFNFNKFKQSLGFTQWYSIKGMGFNFGAFDGAMILLGRYTPKNTNTLPSIILGVALYLLMTLFNLIKTAGFLGYYCWITGELPKYTVTTFRHSFGLPTLLTQVSGSNFWLVCHFLSSFLSYVYKHSIASEVILDSLADIVPCLRRWRNVYPKNMIYVTIWGFIGFAVSLIALRIQIDFNTKFLPVRSSRWIIYAFMFCLIIFAIIPLSLSKITNRGQVDILTFVHHQKSRASASLRKIVFFICLTSCGITSTIFFIPKLKRLIILRSSLYWLSDMEKILWRLGFLIFSTTDAVEAGLILGFTLLLTITAAVIRCAMFRKNQSQYPLCLSLGRLVNSDYEPESLDDTQDGTLELTMT